MPTRDSVLTEQREIENLEALREAAGVGFADLDEGRFSDFASFEELEDHLTRVTEEALVAALPSPCPYRPGLYAARAMPWRASLS